jgi:hypothetical protein
VGSFFVSDCTSAFTLRVSLIVAFVVLLDHQTGQLHLFIILPINNFVLNLLY